MKTRHILTLAISLALTPAMAVAQTAVSKSFEALTQQVKGKEMHCTEKDDRGEESLAQIDAYTIMVEIEAKTLLDNAINALRTDTAKAYSRLEADKKEQPLLFLGNGDMRFQIGTNYDHYLCNIYNDASKQGFRRAYAIEWDDGGAAGTKARVSIVYDKRPRVMASSSFSDIRKVLRTLSEDDSLTFSMKSLERLKQSTSAVREYYDPTNKSKSAAWVKLVDQSLSLIRKGETGLTGATMVAGIYANSKEVPKDLTPQMRKEVIWRIREAKDKLKEDSVLTSMLDAAVNNIKRK